MLDDHLILLGHVCGFLIMEVDLKEAIDEDRALKKIKECGSSFDKLLSLIKSSDSLIAGEFSEKPMNCLM